MLGLSKEETKRLFELQKEHNKRVSNLILLSSNHEGQQEAMKNQTCTFCENPQSILTEYTCCTGCSKLNVLKRIDNSDGTVTYPHLISEWGGDDIRVNTSDGRQVNMVDELNRLERERL